ncbi:unnamed protein product [Caenorhabditis angaria]|uniref:Uncharacterized protein n=1 Tax=Caenorhabditis angaria TaxID=860376 RepID=A0A9P1MY14_9PELO|nr:unnamed protein product [Caenorhabditis angaria]
MIISELVENLSENAIISSLGAENLVVYDRNQLKLYCGWRKFGASVEYTSEVILQLSNPISSRIQITNLTVSKRGEFVILWSKNHATVVRINPEILTKKSMYQSEYLCEANEIALKNRAAKIEKIRILPQKMMGMTICGVLFSDNFVRILNLNRKNVESHLLDVDFRPFLALENDENLEISQNTSVFGLRRHIVSFDFLPYLESNISFSILAIDSESDIYSATIYKTSITESEPVEIRQLERPDELPCTPLDLKNIEISAENQQIASVFVILFDSGILSHVLLIANDENGANFEVFLEDQIEIPIGARGDPELVNSTENSYYLNRYELATSTSLYSIDISKWSENLLEAGQNRGETEVFELAEILAHENCANIVKSCSISVFCEEELDFQEENEEILHFVAHFGAGARFLTAISKFGAENLGENKRDAGARKHVSNLVDNANFEILMKENGTIPAICLSENQTIEEATKIAMEYMKNVEKKLEIHRKLAEIALEKLMNQTKSAKLLTEKNEKIDEKLMDETENVEELRKKAFDLKARIENVRKYLSQLTSRYEENSPLSDIELQMQQRLSQHQHTLSELSFRIPKLSLEMNEQRRLAQLEILKGASHKNRDKFGDIEKNEIEIEKLTERIEKLHCQLNGN